MLTTSEFASETVWYASIGEGIATSINVDCPYSVGTSGVLNSSVKAAPVLSIAVGK